MRIIVVGATGTIGRAVVQALADRHEVIKVGNTRGDFQVDFASPESIKRLYQSVGSADAIVSAAGVARFGNLEALTDDDFNISLTNKLMGQVNLVRLGIDQLRDQGVFTLTSGVLAREPIIGSAAISLVNAGIEAFAGAAALELPRGIRINVVSPPWVSETLEAMGRDGSAGLAAAKVAAAYVASVESQRTGEVIDARAFA